MDHADLSYANLSCTSPGIPIVNGHGASLGIVQCTLLNDANLIAVDLSHANLVGAVFIHTNLKYADLSSANLSERDGLIHHSTDLTQQQLDQVKSCENAILPKGLTCHRNQ